MNAYSEKPTDSRILEDYRLVYRSRQASLIGRREVLTGKAKFGIFGDGKELVQAAIAHVFAKGDWRSGYYRDQTWLMALDLLTLEQFFAALYADTTPGSEPHNSGRNMNNTFSSQLLDKDGLWLNQLERYNISADLAPTGSQMPRAVGLAYSSVLYRHLAELHAVEGFSNNGDEITWVSIGNASTAEGLFWESVNAIGVLQAPAIISIYDDGYGISVPNHFQMVKENISAILKGFQRDPCMAEDCEKGYNLFTTHAWDYMGMIETYRQAAFEARKYHIPALVHVIEATQPQGHSTSGSQERYKTPERLTWEREHDCLVQFRKWILEQSLIQPEQLDQWEEEDRTLVETARKNAWNAFQEPILTTRSTAIAQIRQLAEHSAEKETLETLATELSQIPAPVYSNIAPRLHKALVATRSETSAERQILVEFLQTLNKERSENYDAHQFSTSKFSPFNVKVVQPEYADGAGKQMGYEILNAFFDHALERDPRVIAFGEDVGQLGDVNQGFYGLQEKYGTLRVADTGIREATILGQAIGMALRGLRPICEIQYLDYLLYALQLMADDLANLRWRTGGNQQAPVIIRTRGHRLEGIWHSGSPMAGIINLVRGVHVLVPRDMVQACGFYNTLLQSDDPGLVVEVLNAYRYKETTPFNLTEIALPLGVPEVVRTGSDITIVTYGALVHLTLEAAKRLEAVGIDCEVIDVRSLLPFDVNGMIVDSLKKTSRVLFLDEDMPGGTTAYMMQQVLDVQQGYRWLDAQPRTLSAANHRPAYANDGNYYSKPNIETIFDAVYTMMREGSPSKFPPYLKE